MCLQYSQQASAFNEYTGDIKRSNPTIRRVESHPFRTGVFLPANELFEDFNKNPTTSLCTVFLSLKLWVTVSILHITILYGQNMPFIDVETNLPASQFPDEVVKKLCSTAASILGKPEDVSTLKCFMAHDASVIH